MRSILGTAFAIGTLMALGACSGEDHRYLLPEVTDVPKVRSPLQSVEVQEIALPAYVADSTIFLPDETGALRPQKGQSWADDPARAFTERLAAGLDQALRADVASEPWPFLDPAEAEVEVRLNSLSLETDQEMLMIGQFFVKSDLYPKLQESTRFKISVPLPGTDVNSIAKARSEALKELTNRIAKALGA